VSFIQLSGDTFGVGATELPQVRLWYPVPPASLLARLRSVISLDADARDVAPAASVRPFPVLIYFGSWPGGVSVDNHELIRALVAQGFVVATSAETPLPEGPMDFSSARAYEATLRRADARVKLLARNAGTLVDLLESLNRSDRCGRLTGRLDLSRVGIFGYSFGGAIAAQAAWRDPRFQAVLNLDGWSFGESAQEGIHQPYLFISDDAPLPTDADVVSSDPVLRFTSLLTQADYPRLLHNLARNDGVFLVVAGTSHGSFVDRGRAARIRQILGLGQPAAGRAEGGRVQEVLRSYALAFFRSHLQGIPSELLRGPSVKFPEVQFRALQDLERPSFSGDPVCGRHQGHGPGCVSNMIDGYEEP
jgi:predicted dienelactone hydrolase